MKLLIVTGIYPPDLGGPATYSKLLMDELPKQDIQVDYISFGEVRKFPAGIRHLVFMWRLRKKVQNFDLMYVQDPVSVGFPAMIVGFFIQKKYVLKVVGDFAWEQGRNRFGVTQILDRFVETQQKFPVFIYQAVQTFVARNATKIVVPSEYLKKIVSKWGITKEKITVVYNTFSIPKKIEKIKKNTKEKPTIITAGRLVPWKNFEGIIDAVKVLKKEYPKIKLYIAGDGPDREKIADYIAENNVKRNVVMLGSLSKEELHGRIKVADMFVLNSTYEGLSHVLLEVLSLGTPVIVTDAGGNPELVKDGETGLLVSKENAKQLTEKIRDVVQNKKETTIRAKKGKEFVQSFSTQQTVGGAVEVLKSIDV